MRERFTGHQMGMVFVALFGLKALHHLGDHEHRRRPGRVPNRQGDGAVFGNGVGKKLDRRCRRHNAGREVLDDGPDPWRRGLDRRDDPADQSNAGRDQREGYDVAEHGGHPGIVGSRAGPTSVAPPFASLHHFFGFTPDPPDQCQGREWVGPPESEELVQQHADEGAMYRQTIEQAASPRRAGLPRRSASASRQRQRAAMIRSDAIVSPMPSGEAAGSKRNTKATLAETVPTLLTGKG